MLSICLTYLLLMFLLNAFQLPWFRLSTTLVLGLTLLCAPARPSAAAAPGKQSLESAVADRKARATRYAAAGKLDLALEQVARARERVRDAMTTAGTVRPKTVRNPAYVREVEALRKWYAEEGKKPGARGPGDPQRLAQYQARMAAIRKKYGVNGAKRVDTKAQDQRRQSVAKLMLTMADLDELSAAYYARKKSTDLSGIFRIQAWTARLEAHRTLGNASAAQRDAETLLKLNPPDPGVYNRVGRYFQGSGQFSRAAAVWQRGIGLLETGKARLRTATGSALSPEYRNRMLVEFYREQAFCYTRLGKAAESRKLMQKAAALESARIPARTPTRPRGAGR